MTTTSATTTNPAQTTQRGAGAAPAGQRVADPRMFDAILSLGIPSIGEPGATIGAAPGPSGPSGAASPTTLSGEVSRQVNDAARVELDDLASDELRSPPDRDALAQPQSTPEHLTAREGRPETGEPRGRSAPHQTPRPTTPPTPHTQPPAQGNAAEAQTTASPARSVAASANAPNHNAAARPAPGAAANTLRVDATTGARAPSAAVRVSSAGVARVGSSGSASPQFGAGAESRARQVPFKARPSTPDTGDAARSALRNRVLSQVQRGLGSIMHNKGGSLTMRLTPEHLGEVRVTIDARDGAVNAEFKADSRTTRAILEDGMATLRTALESRGVRVQQLTLHDAAADDRATTQANTPETPSDPSRSDAETGGRGRGDRDRRPGDGTGDHAPDDHDGTDDDTHAPALWTELGLDAIA